MTIDSLAAERRRTAAYKGQITRLRRQHAAALEAARRQAQDDAARDVRHLLTAARAALVDMLAGANRGDKGHFGADLLNYAHKLTREIGSRIR